MSFRQKKSYDSQAFLVSLVRRAMREKWYDRTTPGLVPAGGIVECYLDDDQTPLDVRETLAVAISDCLADSARVGHVPAYGNGSYLIKRACMRALHVLPYYESGEDLPASDDAFTKLEAFSPASARYIAQNLKVVAACLIEGRLSDAEEASAELFDGGVLGTRSDTLRAQQMLTMAYALVADSDRAAFSRQVEKPPVAERYADAGLALSFARSCYDQQDYSGSAAFARLARRTLEGPAAHMDDAVWQASNAVAAAMQNAWEQRKGADALPQSQSSVRYPVDVREPAVRRVIDQAGNAINKSMRGGGVAGQVRLLCSKLNGFCRPL